VVQVQEQIAQLTSELKNVENEIREIDGQLAQGGLPRIISQKPKPAEPQAAPQESVLSKEDEEALAATKAKLAGESSQRAIAKTAFDKALAAITPEAMTDAAVPAVVNSPPPSCNDMGFPTVAPYSRLDGALCRLGRSITIKEAEFDLESHEGPILTILIAKLLKAKTNGESYSKFVTEAQDNRVDQQIGAGPTSNSSTSLVSKGGIPYLFAFAVENGAAEQSQRDTAVTFRFNPAGVIKMFANKGFITGFQETEAEPALKFLRKTSIGLTFDTSRGDTPGTFTGNRQQLSQVQARIEFVNERDPRHKKYLVDWEKFVADEGVKLADAISKVTVATTNWADPGAADDDITFKDPALQAWLLKTQEKIAAVDPSFVGVARINAIAKVISEQADQIPIDLVSEDTVNAITEFAEKNQTYLNQKNALFDRIARGKIFTLDYTNKREVNAPDTSTFNFIAATGTGSRIDLTANGSFTVFHSLPAATLLAPKPGRFRDFQFAGQMTVPLKAGFDFWFSGRYERLLENATTFTGTTIPGTTGDIAIGQFGLNIPIPGLGMKFPVSFTVANRTELVKEKEVRGNFGFTFNWDTIFSKIKPF
jgi:hypothetical protein